ncbi:MAG: glycosyltransferase [Hyphomicrobium sp.]
MEHTVGVCLATFNGREFIQAQLDSIARQTRRPDQIVISDDGSTDGTFEIAVEFSERSGLKVEILRRPPDDRSRFNFNYAVRYLKTDIIAFCDQDDIWHPEKLQRTVNAFTWSSDVLAVLHSYRHFENRHGRNRWLKAHRLRNAVVPGVSLPPVLNWLGMSMAVHRTVIAPAEIFEESWERHFNSLIARRPDCFHDHWSHMHDVLFLTVAKNLGSIATIGEILADHRIHSGNLTQTKQTWKQPDEIQASWGTGQNVLYKIESAFCREFMSLLEQLPADVLPADRRNLMIEHYATWSKWWKLRSEIHDRSSTSLRRLNALKTLAFMGAYRPKRSGGLGSPSFVKDSAASIGVFLGSR